MLGSRYDLVALLGEGAMGRVYLARNRELGRKEAVKVLRRELAGDEQLMARFRREARATSRLCHPNVVSLYDHGRLPDGLIYIAMEYVDGAPLASVLRDHALLAPARALPILCQLAAAVEHAHSRGVLHRDLKPGNLMLVQGRGQQDILKVLDFGVAKIIAPEYQESILVSQQGVVYGTPLYMAPEQFYEQVYDPRSDIYAIGCVAFELLTGEPPFSGQVPQLIHDHTETAPPRPGALVSGIPAAVEDVVLRCLDKRPERRFQTAGELLAALMRLLPGAPVATTRAGPAPAPATGDVYRTLGAPAAPAAPPGDDEERTRGRERALVELTEEMAAALLEDAPGEVGAASAPARLRAALRAVRVADGALRRGDVERAALEVQQDDAAAHARARQAQLERAIAVLRADLDRGAPDPTLDDQIAALSGRLAEVRAEDEALLARLDDEAIAQAARHADLTEARQAAHARLAALVDELAPRHARALGPLLLRYRALRAAP